MIYDLQKANMWKRISAFLFDTIMVVIIAVGFAYLTSIITSYDKYQTGFQTAYTAYEEQYGVTFSITEEDYNKFTQEEKEVYDKAFKALSSDEQANYNYNMIVNLTLLITSLSIFLSLVVWEFVIPLFLKNGMTLGKKIFGIAVMKTDGTRLNTISLFVRSVLGKYTLEIMIPILIFIMMYFGILGLLGTIILFALLIIQIIILIATKTNSLIHDLIASTVTVDFASQMIFDTLDDKIEYQKKKAAEEAATSVY